MPTSAQHAGYNVALQHNQIVIQMNGVLHFTSGGIQCRLSNVVSMIDEPGCSAGDLAIPFEQETIMLKTISAALLAASVLAAPVLAAQSTKTTANAPVIKTTQTRTAVKASHGKTIHGKTVQSTAVEAKPALLNANAKMGSKHHRKHLSYHHRHHGKMSALKTRPAVHAKTTFKTTPKVSLKPAVSTTKRG